VQQISGWLNRVVTVAYGFLFSGIQGVPNAYV